MVRLQTHNVTKLGKEASIVGDESRQRGCNSSKKLVGTPRFELGTPCTPCKCATRLRHAPTRFLLEMLDARVGRSAREANDTLFFTACSPSLLPQSNQPA